MKCVLNNISDGVKVSLQMFRYCAVLDVIQKKARCDVCYKVGFVICKFQSWMFWTFD